MSVACGTYGEEHKCIQGFGVYSRENKSLERSEYREEYNTKVDVKDIGWKGVAWSNLTHEEGELAGCCDYGNELLVSMNFWTSCVTTIVYSRILFHGII
jgi:hypothetical protein